MAFAFGQHISGLTVDGKELHAAVFNETEVRAAAGLTMVTGAVAFSYAYFDKNYTPLRIVAAFFFLEFLIRIVAGLRWSPVGVVAYLTKRRRAPPLGFAQPQRLPLAARPRFARGGN